jgi:hypothetical protein
VFVFNMHYVILSKNNLFWCAHGSLVLMCVQGHANFFFSCWCYFFPLFFSCWCLLNSQSNKDLHPGTLLIDGGSNQIFWCLLNSQSNKDLHPGTLLIDGGSNQIFNIALLNCFYLYCYTTYMHILVL